MCPAWKLVPRRKTSEVCFDIQGCAECCCELFVICHIFNNFYITRASLTSRTQISDSKGERPGKMKIPPTNNMNGFETYEDDPYFPEGLPNHNQNTNGTVEEFNPPVQDSDFSEYMWMENEEEFDKEVLQRLEEEELMEECMLQHMLDDERTGMQMPEANGVLNNLTNGKTEVSEMAKSSTLNPHAAEFVPSWGHAAATEAKSS